MTEKTATALQNAAEAAGLDLRFRDDYSGLGMMGEKTHAVYGPFNQLMQAVAQAGADLAGVEDDDADLEDFVDEVGCLRQDSMGRDPVFY